MKEQTISVPLKPGARVSVMDEVDMDEGGFTASDVFHDTVKTYVPETRKLEFEDSDIGYDEFVELVNNHSSFQVIKE
jgi:hypothetical protein